MKIKRTCSICKFCKDYKNPKSPQHLNIVICTKDPSYETERFTPRYGVGMCSDYQRAIFNLNPIWK